MNVGLFFAYIGVMAGVTYLIRAIPLALFQGEIKNTFVKSFLAYVPYAVLGAMTFPTIIGSTGNLVSGIAATVVALILAFYRKSLLTVAVVACVAAFLVQLCQNLI